MALLVDRMRKLHYANAFVIVFNGTSPRFSNEIQESVKIILKSFGVKILNNIVMVFNMITTVKIRKNCEARASQFQKEIFNLAKTISSEVSLNHDIPAYYFDCTILESISEEPNDAKL